MDNIVRSMMTDLKKALDDKELAENIIERDNEVNRLSYLVAKVLKIAFNDKSILGSMGLSQMDILRYRDLNLDLERIADRIKNIAGLISDLKPNHKKYFMKLFEDTESMYQYGMTAFYKFSAKLSDELSGDRFRINTDIKQFIADTNCVTCSQIAINLFQITGHVNDIGRIVRYMD